MSLYNIYFLNQNKREEQYGIGNKYEFFPHGYILSELLKVIKPIPYDCSDNINIAENDILNPQYEEALVNAKTFLDNFDNPHIDRQIFFEDTTYKDEQNEVPDYEKPVYIVKEALILRKSIESILQDYIESIFQDNFIVGTPHRSLQGTIEKICSFREIEDIFKSRITRVSIMPELTLVKKNLPVWASDNKRWEGVKRTSVLDIEFRYAVENFITLPWLELLHAIKNNYLIYKCPICDNYYFHYLRKRKNCEECGYPSTKQTEEKRIRDEYKKKIQRGMPRDQANRDLEKLGLKPIKERTKGGRK